MRRRTFLASAGIAALAGCSNGDSSATPTATEPGTGSPNFELLGVEAPKTRALNNPTIFAIGVRNTGSGEGTFSSPLERRVNGGEWKEVGTVEMTLSAGETGEWRSPRFVPQYLGTLHFRLPEFDETWSIEIEPKRLDFGNYYATPTDLYINVLGGSFESAYPTATNETTTNESNGTPTVEGNTTDTTSAPEGQTWAVMRLDVRNRLEEPIETPDASSFVLEVGGERMSQHQDVSDDPYEGGELAGRTVKRGDLVYAVPAGTQARDLSLWWEASLPKGDLKAIWTK
jgi:hypothetical protein